jgi:endoglucanase
MAQSYRIYKKFNNQLPGFADSCLAASQKAWKWSQKNPNQLYRQGEINSSFNPDIQTGEYGDGSADDEFQWAALELFASTGKMEYYDEANLSFTLRNGFDIPSWQKVNTLGLYTLVRLRNSIPEVPEMEMVKERIIKMASELKSHAATSPYGVPMGIRPDNFSWGSNSICANQGMLLIQAYNLTNEIIYLDAAISSLDYLLGRNPTGYSFVTGYGNKHSNDPHHRPSEADGIEDAVPGMLVGGPNPGQEDISSCGNRYTSKFPALSYIDHKCSYASNEIAINWNAPFAYLAYSIEINLKSK